MLVASISETQRFCKIKNTKNLTALCFFAMLLGVSLSFSDMSAFAESSQTTVLRLDDEISLEKTETTMSIPETNTLPWGSVKGKVDNPVQGYPVIIQFFKLIEDDPIHVAQVNLKGDGSYEHKFRVLSIDEGNVTHFFEGDYHVKIFKVVKTPLDNLDSA